eukprot:CAMPEP_0169063724 /NCGR_PEP_ID=MMETSP1015-20121227/1441_1 /TAXON_ID=342587 /ORGANISM="Karlodinium micrum, Strain CCMP2283" /LENGTH=91 /DNA_ID=CAMNT_0009122087 /DNA_START=180 /DNA_END=455 /DNA_ORIENTATION=+
MTRNASHSSHSITHLPTETASSSWRLHNVEKGCDVRALPRYNINYFGTTCNLEKSFSETSETLTSDTSVSDTSVTAEREVEVSIRPNIMQL